MSDHFVIIGNGAAGFQAAKALRRADATLRISLFTQDRYPFYLRRQLGDFLAGNLTLSELIFQSRNAYRRERIDLFLMTRIERLDPPAHEITFASGQRVRYDRALLATGTEALPPDIPGVSLEGVTRFDTLSEAIDIKRRPKDVRRAAILSEGIIGLNLAESLTGRGIRVTYLTCGERFWPEVLDEGASQLLETVLEENGVTLRRNTTARAIVGAGARAIGVETTDGDVMAAELVGSGCRRRPAVSFLEGSGIQIGRGIRVDAALRTNLPDVFAAGDVTEPVEPGGGRDRPCPLCWQRAWTQGAVAAASMLDQSAAAPPEAIRVRTTVFGHDLAVIGQAHQPQGGTIEAVETRAPPDTYRRLVFDEDRLVGAVVFGTGEWVHELNRMVAQSADRQTVAQTIGLPETHPASGALPQTVAQHCPICAAELVVHRGTRIGSSLRCRACSTELKVRWDGERGWFEVSPL